MFVELTTGKDSFRRRGNSPKRNVGVNTYIRTTVNDAKGRAVHKIKPVFAAFRDKDKGLGKTALVHTIPATNMFGNTDAGQWFVNRHEVGPGCEILIEYTRRDATGFGQSIEYLMLLCDPTAPLYRVRLNLPAHPLSSVPHVYFEGRFFMPTRDDQLNSDGIDPWRRHLHLIGADFDVCDLSDASQEKDDQVFEVMRLEAAPVVAKTSTKVVKTSKGTERIKIKRGRRIKT